MPPSRPQSKSRPPARPQRPLLPRQIYDSLSLSVVGQEDAKQALAVAAYHHVRRQGMPAHERKGLRKSNVLLIGPTGTGKTLLVRKLAECLDLPLAIVDATEYTEAGYYGKDIEQMITELYHRAQHSLLRAQQGVLFIDEIDKLARRAQHYKTGGGSRDIGGEGVQQALLKILEGREIEVPVSPSSGPGKQETLRVDTSEILFIAAGTFSDLFDQPTSRPVGFAEPATPTPKSVGTQDLVSYGMLAELLGRLPVRVQLSALDEQALIDILHNPGEGMLAEWTQLYALDGVELSITPDALRELARAALAERCGARGLRSLLERVCRDSLFSAPEHPGTVLVLDAAFVRQRLATPAERVRSVPFVPRSA